MTTSDYIKTHPIWIAHIGSSIMCIGSPSEIEAYMSNLTHSVTCIRISKTIEEYGDACWYEGYEPYHHTEW